MASFTMPQLKLMISRHVPSLLRKFFQFSNKHHSRRSCFRSPMMYLRQNGAYPVNRKSKMPTATNTTNNNNNWHAKSLKIQKGLDELERNREAFEIIKSIDSAANQIETNNTTNNSAAKAHLLTFVSADALKRNYPQDSAILLKSLRLWKAGIVLYAYNLFSTAILTVFKFQIFSLFAIAYSALLLVIAPLFSFFTCHYSLVTAASYPLGSLLQKGMLCVSLLGLALQSVFWVFLGLGLMTGASGGIFTVLSHLNAKEWPLFLVGFLNLLILSGCLLFALYLKQQLVRKYLLQ